jgi:integrase
VDFRDLVTVAWETGARPQDVTRMEAGHIEVKNQRAVIPMKEAKGKKRIRIVYFTDNALEVVTRRMERYPEGALFRNTRGSMWTTFSVDCRFKRLVEKFGKKIALYDLRHSFSTRLLEAGVDPLTVSLLLGHVDTTVLTRVYAHTAQNSEHLLKALKA